jgi:hypothetical protein
MKVGALERELKWESVGPLGGTKPLIVAWSLARMQIQDVKIFELEAWRA